jgi:hypothetical protein
MLILIDLEFKVVCLGEITLSILVSLMIILNNLGFVSISFLG